MLDDEKLVKLIKVKRGNLSAVARSLKVSRQTVYNHIKANPTVEAAAAEARETMLDDAEDVLYKKVREGSTAELIFFLKTQGKSRGYTEKSEMEQSGELVIRVIRGNANNG